ncbi:MAG: DMT family transporter [Nitrospiraceae bacterium]
MPRIALLFSTLVWGATFPATKAVLEQVPPLSFLFLRFLIGSVLVVAGLVMLRWRLERDRRVLQLSLIATVWLFFGYALQTVGLRFTTASNSGFITALYVVFVPLFLRRFSSRIWLSASIAIVGLWVLVQPTVSLNLGDVLTLGSAAAFAAHIACLERFTRVTDAASLFCWQMVFMALAMLSTAIWESPHPDAFTPTTVLVVGLGVTGVLATGAFAVQMWAQRLLPAQQVALLFSLEPAYAAWLAWYFLGERLDVSGWIGSGLILCAVLLGSVPAGMTRPQDDADRCGQLS